MADDDGIAAAEIARQIAALRPRVQGARGVMGYLEQPEGEGRKDVNKLFLSNTIRSVDTHNRRHEEDKCWTLRRMEQELDSRHHHSRRSNRSRSGSRDRGGEARRSDERGRRHRRSRNRSRSRSGTKHRRPDSPRHEKRSRRTRSPSRSPASTPHQQKKREDDNERSYWAQKKAEKTRKLWENLHAGGTVSVENAPDFSSEESEADDVKPPPPQQPSTESPKSRKKRKKHSKKSEKKAKRRRSRS